MPQEIPATCDGCGKRLWIDHTLSFPKCGLVLVSNNDSAKEWVFLGSQALVPSDITYEPKINGRTVQGESTGAGAQKEGGTADGGADPVREAQGGRARTVNGAVRDPGTLSLALSPTNRK